MSHVFNIVTTEIVVYLQQKSNACAVFAIVVYYEAAAISFVQLLQYGAFQYARLISSNPEVTPICRKLWNYITMPGIYRK